MTSFHRYLSCFVLLAACHALGVEPTAGASGPAQDPQPATGQVVTPPAPPALPTTAPPAVKRTDAAPAPIDWEPPARPRRHPTRGVWHLALGGVSFANLGTEGMGTSVAGGYGWDMDTFLLRLLADLNTKASAFFGSVSLSVTYFILARDISPFVSADFGAAFAKADGPSLFSGKSVSGFLVGPGAGVMFFRESSVNLELALRYGYLLNTNAFGHPGLFTIRVGLYF